MHAAILLFGFLLTAVLRAADATPRPADVRDEIADLRLQIARHDELYHRRWAPEIGDADYDRMRRRLAELERANPAAAQAAPPLAAVGDDRTGLFQTARHREPMSGLEKAHEASDLRAFHVRLAKLLGRDDLDYVVEPKLDGLAVSVTYEKGRMVRAVTRGNGVEGDDITANVIQLAGVPRDLTVAAEGDERPEVVELRGEIYVPWTEFERVNSERSRAGEPRFANPRSLAAGAVRQVDSREVARRGLRVAFFGLGACEPGRSRPPTQRDLHAAIKRWGLPGIPVMWTARGAGELERVLEIVRRARLELAYPTDGAVVKLDPVAPRERVGATEAGPRWALAYKFAPERVETRVRAITLQVGRTGVLTPVAELEPVRVAGSTITRATLHNREEIARRDIRIGDFVYLEKAGDVIPAVVGVNRERRPPEAQPYAFPIVCPECYAPVVRTADEVAVRCSGGACPAQLRRRLEHFASKACVEIEGLGPAMIDMLVGNGWVKELPDLYRLRRTDLLTLGRNNERSVERLLAAIETSKRAELWRVIHGLGIPQVGAATAKDLARQCGSLAGLAENGPKAVVALAEPRYQALIADLIAVGLTGEAGGVGAGPAAGRIFVLTGTLPTFTRAQATEKIESAGGRVAGSVSRGVHYVVVGTDPGAKLAQARELGIAILDEAGLRQLLDGGVRK